MKKFSLIDLTALAIWLVPIVYLVLVFPTLPLSVPMHWGINGQVDRYGSKGEFVLSQGILIFVSLLMYLLMKYLPVIDPKKAAKYSAETFQKLAIGLLLFISVLSIVIIYATAHHGFKIEKVIFPVMGLLFAFMGNMMNNIKPNYFVGFRTPWTLESEDTWRATHRLVSKMWFAGGVLITIVTLLLPSKAGFIVFMSIVGIITIVPFVYSYRYFKSQQSNQNL